MTGEKPTEIEEELLEEMMGLSPLSALNPEEVDRLTSRQRHFLISFISTGSVAQARKMAKVQPAELTRWQDDDQFKRVYDTIKNPAAFALNLRNALIWRAMLAHFELFTSDKVSHRQWAIERAYALQPKDEGEGNDAGGLSLKDAQRLAQSAVAALDQADRQKLIRAPFSDGEVVEGEVVDDGRRSDSTGGSGGETNEGGRDSSDGVEPVRGVQVSARQSSFHFTEGD